MNWIFAKIQNQHGWNIVDLYEMALNSLKYDLFINLIIEIDSDITCYWFNDWG